MRTRTPQAYAEEYQERIAIKIENGIIEAIAKSQARQEVIAYVREAGGDVVRVMELMDINN